MEPTIQSQQIVLVSGLPFLFHPPKSGDLVAYRLETTNKVFVKRITRQKGKQYFLQGDNASDSMDSRQLGWVQKEQILGKVILAFKNNSL